LVVHSIIVSSTDRCSIMVLCLLQLAANNNRFKLVEMLTVPMQRVLKYHLLLKVHSSFCILAMIHNCHQLIISSNDEALAPLSHAV